MMDTQQFHIVPPFHAVQHKILRVMSPSTKPNTTMLGGDLFSQKARRKRKLIDAISIMRKAEIVERHVNKTRM